MVKISEDEENGLDPEIIENDFVIALRELTANLLRVVRGAGRPNQIGRQAVELIAQFKLFYKAHGHYPMSARYSDYLGLFSSSEKVASLSAIDKDRVVAEQRLIKASLQIVASDLIHQRVQKSVAENDFYQAFNEMSKAVQSQQTTRRPPEIASAFKKTSS